MAAPYRKVEPVRGLDRFATARSANEPTEGKMPQVDQGDRLGATMPKHITRQAPYLRRYARALTGSQQLGDDLVRGAMEDMLSGERSLDANLPLRVSLYQVLHQVWKVEGLMARDESVADRRLQGLAPKRRAALLLVGMEGFSPAESAKVLDMSDLEFEQTLTDAEVELDQQLLSRVLIIEDEPIIALDLTRLVRELGHTVVGTAATREDAVALARETRPGLVLADIRLADGSNGIDATQDILADMDIPVIFITAFPEHLLTGEKPEPAFLITKPFREDAVKALVAQALFFHTPKEQRLIA